MYLKTINKLSGENGNVRCADIARSLNYSKPSISRAVRILGKEGYLYINHNGTVELTETGRKIALRVCEKQEILALFFQKIAKVSKKRAELDACRIEHVISEEVFQGIKRFIEKENVFFIDEVK
nr:metal-dependent transcriptional regulator [Clostridium aminobutyricum]